MEYLDFIVKLAAWSVGAYVILIAAFLIAFIYIVIKYLRNKW